MTGIAARLPALWLAVCLVVALVGQPWVAAYQATLAGLGIEVCTSEGMKRVDADGNVVSVTGQPSHDCCGTGIAGLPGNTLAVPPTARHDSPVTLLTAGRLAAEWQAPLSRGPPTRS
jgi:NADPH-dependent 2,4-dienoyl-CoA reductase/sulfur reductase-like enzyme